MDEHENAAHGAHFEEAKWQSAIDGNADASESKCALNQTHKVRLCVKLPTGQKNTHRARCTTVNITDEAWPIINMSCMVVAANTAESSLCSHIFPLSLSKRRNCLLLAVHLLVVASRRRPAATAAVCNE